MLLLLLSHVPLARMTAQLGCTIHPITCCLSRTQPHSSTSTTVLTRAAARQAPNQSWALPQDGWLTRRGFLARWRHLTARDTPAALAGLLYLGYKPEGELGILFSLSKPRRAERKEGRLSRSLVQACPAVRMIGCWRCWLWAPAGC